MEEGRSRRALAWIGLAAVAVAIAGLVYLRPTLGLPAAAPSPAVPVPALVLRPVAASFADDRQGWVAVVSGHQPGEPSALPVVMTTGDGGRTWRRAPEVTIPSSPGPGLLLGRPAAAPAMDEFSLSADGGRSWRPLRLPPLDDHPPGTGRYLRFAFADAGDGWLLDTVVGSSGVAFATRVTLWRTTDGGRSWTRLPSPDVPAPDPQGVGASVPAEAMTFVDADRGALAVVSGSTTAVLAATGDGGATWSRVAALDVDASPPPVLSVAVLASAGPGLLAVVLAFAGPSPPGARGSARVYTVASADGGRTWTPLRPGPEIQLDGVPSVVGKDRLLMLDGRRLWTSVDGGATWSARWAVLPADLEPVGGVSGGRRTLFVLATRRGGVGLDLLKSSDGGGHWAPVPLPRVLPPP